jgi:small subunit ribosomal protein S3Ae
MRKRKIDTWKTKMWFHLYTPEILEKKELCLVPANSPDALVGRIATIPVTLLGGNPYSGVFLRFKITSVEGTNANTEWWGIETAQNRISMLVSRRRTSKVEIIYRKPTKDGTPLKTYLYVFTSVKIGSKQKSAIRKITEEILKEYYENKTKDEIMLAILNEEIQRKVEEASKKIAPIRECVCFKCNVIG